MSLPAIFIFENHLDAIPKFVCQGLISELSAHGYDTFGTEFPQESTAAIHFKMCETALQQTAETYDFMVRWLKTKNVSVNLLEMDCEKLPALIGSHFPCADPFWVAERIRCLPAQKATLHMHQELQRRSFLLQGIDINDKAFHEKIGKVRAQFTDPMVASYKLFREGAMLANIERIQRERDGCIFLCGSNHAPMFMSKFRESSMFSDVMCYFPYSAKPNLDNLDYVAKVLDKHKEFKGHVFPLSDGDVKAFCKRVVEDVISRTKYLKEVQGNSHAEFLSDLFKVNFRAFVRPGYYVDALVEMEIPEIESIQKRLHEIGIETRDVLLNGHHYLAVRSVNSRPVAVSIRTLKPQR